MMEQLDSSDGVIRKDARESLVALGRISASSLGKALRRSGSVQLRWEAAKALGEIGDKRSIPVLVGALMDRDPDVAWLAAKGLARYGITAWPPILRALVKVGPDSALLRRGAHHVLVNQRREGLNGLLLALTKDLENNPVRESVTLDSYALLNRITQRRTQTQHSIRTVANSHSI